MEVHRKLAQPAADPQGPDPDRANASDVRRGPMDQQAALTN